MTRTKTGVIMQSNFANSSLATRFLDAWADLTTYFSSLTSIQWGILATCAVAFGFLCLKGPGINR